MTRHAVPVRHPADVRSAVATGPLGQRKCACGKQASGGPCGACRRRKSALQRAAAGRRRPDQAPPIVFDVLRAPGRPLDTATRTDMEARFGQDFSHVRVHSDAQAAASAEAVAARAYTVANHIAFAEGAYAPTSAPGRRLLAHELAHVVQQGGTTIIPSRLAIGATETAAERQAQSAAAQRDGTRQQRSHGHLAVGVHLQRTPAALAVRAAMLGACAYRYYRHTLDNYSGQQGYNDKFMHCYASCKTASHCGGIPVVGIPTPLSLLFSQAVGTAKELADIVKDKIGIGTPGDASWDDWFANQYGIAAALKITTPCEESCRRAPGAVAPSK